MSSFPTMPVGVDRYLADTAHLTLEQQAVHFRLQIYAWRSPGCRLADDDAKLARMLGITGKRWASLKPAVMALWTLTDGTWANEQGASKPQPARRTAKPHSITAPANANHPRRKAILMAPNAAAPMGHR